MKTVCQTLVRLRVLWAAWVVLALSLALPVAVAADREVSLFSGSALSTPTYQARDKTAVSPAFQEVLRAAKRYRSVTINPLLSASGRVAEGTVLNLELFPDRVLRATVDRVNVDINGVRSIRAKMEGDRLGYVLLTIDNGRMLGQIRSFQLNGEFQINQVGGGSEHVLQEIDPFRKDVLPEGESKIPPKSPVSQRRSPVLLNNPVMDPLQPMTVDVMVVYTPAAATWAAANAGSINSVISQAMIRGQQAFDNSGVYINLNLVHSAQVNYVESGDSGIDLSNIRSGTGEMAVVHTWRNQYGADLVHLVTVAQDTGGIAYLLNTAQGTPDFGYGLTRVQQAYNTETVVHEIGHNMGLSHHKQQNFQAGPTSWFNEPTRLYSAGWRWADPVLANCCSSIMTYESGSYFTDGQTRFRVPYFSSPGVAYSGVATGHAADGDNARTLRETKGVVANYRPSLTGGFTLSVNSVGASGVAITSATGPTYAGATNYTRSAIASGTSVTLTAPAQSGGATFSNWTGCASAAGMNCTVTMTQDRSVTVNYTPPVITPLSNGVSVTGISGALSSEQLYSIAVPAGATNLQISTTGGTGDMDMHVRFGSLPTLSLYDCRPWAGGNQENCTFATPSNGTYYVMLHGYAAYSGLTLTATYTLSSTSYSLTVSSAGASGVSISSSTSSNYAGVTNYIRSAIPSGTGITLTAPASVGAAVFSSWSGCATTVNRDCTVSMTQNRSVTANYNTPNTYTLTVNSLGAGGVSITSAASPTYAGVTNYTRSAIPSGTGITLTAPASAGGANFSAWTGCASTSNRDCTVSMTQNRAVTANYTAPVVITPLTNGVPVSGLSGAQGSDQFFSITVPAGMSKLRVTTAGGTGDADLFVRFASLPSESVHDCSSGASGTNTEACVFASPAAGTYYVLVDGWQAYAGTALTATYCLNNLSLFGAVNSSVTHIACETLSSSSTQGLIVESAGVLQLRAGDGVVLNPGFSTRAGSRVRVTIDPALAQ